MSWLCRGGVHLHRHVHQAERDRALPHRPHLPAPPSGPPDNVVLTTTLQAGWSYAPHARHRRARPAQRRRPATTGRTRSSGTACGCSPTSTDGRLRLTSRTESDVTVSFPELAGLADVVADGMLDGEVVAFADGKPDFGALAERMHVQDARRAAALAQRFPVSYVVFDVLRLYGVPLLGRGFDERRHTLERIELGEPGTRAVAGAGRVRRRRGAAGSHPGQRPGGHRQQAAQLDVPAGAAQPGLGEARPPQHPDLRGRRVAPADRDDVRARRAAGRAAGRRRAADLPRPGRLRHRPDRRPKRLSGAAGPVGPQRLAVRRRRPARRRPRHPLGAAHGLRRGRAPRLRPAAGGCASRPGAGCGTDVRVEELVREP